MKRQGWVSPVGVLGLHSREKAIAGAESRSGVLWGLKPQFSALLLVVTFTPAVHLLNSDSPE